MKKVLVAAFSLLMFGVAASAQPRALGVRATYGAEVSYQHSFGTNFVEADLGLFGNGFYLTGVYDFVFASEGNFNFYAGPGAQIGFYGSKDDDGNSVTKMGLGVVGQIGMEYNFSLPLSLSLDWRPGISLTGGGFGWQGFALGIRYRF